MLDLYYTRKDEVKSTVEQASFPDHPQLVWEWGYSGTPLFQTPWIADFAINIQPNMHGAINIQPNMHGPKRL